MSDAQQHDEIKAALIRMADEGGGVWEVDTFAFNADTLTALLANAMSGDRWAGTTLAGIDGICKRSTTDNPMLCFACDTAFDGFACPAYILRMLPKCDNPTTGAIEGICFRCAERASDKTSLSEIVVNAVRQHISPDARMIRLHGSTGNA